MGGAPPKTLEPALPRFLNVDAVSTMYPDFSLPLAFGVCHRMELRPFVGPEADDEAEHLSQQVRKARVAFLLIVCCMRPRS